MRAPPVTRFYSVHVQRPNIEWARIWITDDGCFTTISDYGNYGYWWGGLPEIGMRRFLIQVDDDYLLGKLSAGERESDVAETANNVKREIISRRRDGLFTREEARDEWDLLRGVDFSSELGLWDWVRASKIEEAYRFTVDRYPQQVQCFVRELWPIFVEQLKAELAEESHQEFQSIVEHAIDGSQAR